MHGGGGGGNDYKINRPVNTPNGCPAKFRSGLQTSKLEQI